LEDQQQHQVSQTPSTEKQLLVQREAKIYLRNIAVWGRFIAFSIAAVAAIFLSIVVYSYYTDHFGLSEEQQSGATNTFYFGTILCLLLLFYPSYRLFRFCKLVDHAVLFKDSDDLTKALRNLKSFIQVMGLITVILVTAYIASLVYAATWLVE
jgi:hypothetical protein